MTNPIADALTDRANSYTTQLREHTHALADRPDYDAWWDLRKIVKGTDTWRTEMQRALQTMDDVPAYATSAYLSLSAACEQAHSTIRDLSSLFADQAAARTSRRDPDDRPAGPGTFIAKYGGKCTACGAQIEIGDVATFGLAKKLRHAECPNP